MQNSAIALPNASRAAWLKQLHRWL